jgi:hypothetical protein
MACAHSRYVYVLCTFNCKEMPPVPLPMCPSLHSSLQWERVTLERLAHILADQALMVSNMEGQHLLPPTLYSLGLLAQHYKGLEDVKKVARALLSGRTARWYLAQIFMICLENINPV